MFHLVPAEEVTGSEGKLSSFAIVTMESSSSSNKEVVERDIGEFHDLGKENDDQGNITNSCGVEVRNLVTVE